MLQRGYHSASSLVYKPEKMTPQIQQGYYQVWSAADSSQNKRRRARTLISRKENTKISRWVKKKVSRQLVGSMGDLPKGQVTLSKTDQQTEPKKRP